MQPHLDTPEGLLDHPSRSYALFVNVCYLRNKPQPRSLTAFQLTIDETTGGEEVGSHFVRN